MPPKSRQNRRPKTHVLLNRKGGVGKTTLSVNLAAVVASVLGGTPDSCPVYVASLDPQASAVWWAERDESNLLPFDFDQVSEDPADLEALGDADYDHVFVDCPGSFARPATLGRVLDMADDVIVPCAPEPLCYDPTEHTIRDMIEPKGLPYLVVRNLWDPRDGRTDLDKLTRRLDERQLVYAKTVVRRYKMHTNASESGTVVTQYPRGRIAAEARNDFLGVALELGYGGQAAT